MLKIRQLSKTYTSAETGERMTVLQVPELSVKAKERVALTGPSGSGKSTLLHVIAGIVRPTSGTVMLNGTELTTLSEARLDAFRAKFIGYIFQSFHLLPGYSALENVMIAMQFANSFAGQARIDRAKELLERVGLQHRLRHRPDEMSSGEQQRVAIARALAKQPSIVLADEPTASLDEANGSRVLALLTELCAEYGAALLLCTHDMSLIKHTDRMIGLREGVLLSRKEEIGIVTS